MPVRPYAFVAAALLSGGIAQAADYEPPIAIGEAPEVPVEVGSGWYLRGDLTYNVDRTEPVYSDPFIWDSGHTDFGGGGGIGYHFTDLFRADATVSFLSKDRFDYDDGLEAFGFDTQSWSGMVNAYLDLGTIAGFTPYVGAGAGVLYTRQNMEGGSDGFSYDLEDDQYKFAYSLQAGLSYRVSKNASLDLGYQFLSSPNTEYVEVSSGGVALREGLDYHQVRIGLRYDLW